MNKNNLIKSYLRERGMRVLDSADKKLRVDVYDSMSPEEIKRRVDALEIQDLDLTIDDSGEDVEELEEQEEDEPVDDDKPAEDKKVGWVSSGEDDEDEYGDNFKVISEEDTNEFRMPAGNGD